MLIMQNDNAHESDDDLNNDDQTNEYKKHISKEWTWNQMDRQTYVATSRMHVQRA